MIKIGLTSYKDIFENSSEAILIINADNKVVEKVNQGTVEFYKFNSKNELVGKNILSLVHNKELVLEVIKKVRDEGIYTFWTKHMTQENEEIDVEIKVKLIKYCEKDCYLLSVQNITERVRFMSNSKVGKKPDKNIRSI